MCFHALHVLMNVLGIHQGNYIQSINKSDVGSGISSINHPQQ